MSLLTAGAGQMRERESFRNYFSAPAVGATLAALAVVRDPIAASSLLAIGMAARLFGATLLDR